MYRNGWRTVILDRHESLSLGNENIIVKDEMERKEIPISQIREIYITADRGSITLPLLIRLAEENINVCLCDSKHNPKGRMLGIGLNGETAGRIMDQATWTKRRKDAVWKKIVELKLKMQGGLLERLQLSASQRLYRYRQEVVSGDITNREAVSAKVYFVALFGKDFERFHNDDINTALNYGYTILCNSFNRAITKYGFSTALGIHHCNRRNEFNLSCDLMEPFRPFVDEIVYRRRNAVFDWDYRYELITMIQNKCVYDGREVSIADAIELFSYEVCKMMMEARGKLKDLDFNG